MKKKIYFIVTSLIGIMLSLSILYKLDSFIADQISIMQDTYSMLGTEYVEKLSIMIQTHGRTIYTGINLISIFLYIYILANTLKDKISEKRNKLLASSIGLFLTSSNSIMELIAVINIGILAFTKHEKVEKEKLTPMPVPKKKKETTKKSIIMLIAYFSQLLWGRLIPDNLALPVSIIYDIALLILAIYLFKNELQNGLKELKSHPKVYFHYLLQKYLIGMGIMIVVSTIALAITNNPVSVNQEALNSLPLWYIAPASIIFAPIVEETVFRVCIRNIIKNDKLYIIASGLIFGYLHAMHEESIINIIAMTMPYATLGGVFAYIYVKTNNPTASMTVHAGHNTLATIVSIFMR